MSMGTHTARRGLAALLLAASWAWPQPALALLQTDNDRTPTWQRFNVRAQGEQEHGVFYGMAAFCQFPEQYPPKRPNPRWESERPSRRHFVEHLNPAFYGCVIKPFAAMPQFHDFQIPAELVFEFEKSLPKGFEPFRSGERSATMKSNFAVAKGKTFVLPELAGAANQGVVLHFSISGKALSKIALRIDSQYKLRFHEYDRTADDAGPKLMRRWGEP